MSEILIEYDKLFSVISGKYAVYDNWESWSQCSASCGGGKRNRNRVCLKSDFPPKNDPQTERLISTYGSLAKVPLTKGKSSFAYTSQSFYWCRALIKILKSIFILQITMKIVYLRRKR